MTQQKAREKKTVTAPATSPQPSSVSLLASQAQQIQVRAQRAREVAVLKQRFAESDVARVIAEADRDQFAQQIQRLQQQIAALEEEIVALKNPKDVASNEGAAPKSETDPE